jgi:iron(III) transport system permease protein
MPQTRTPIAHPVAAAVIRQITAVPLLYVGGRAVFRWLLALPLVIPAYVAAVCRVILLRRGGLLDHWVGGALGLGPGELPLPPPYGLGGAAVVIVLCTFPYVFMPVAAALRSFDTLPVRIWTATSESVYTQAAPPAFLLIALTMVSLVVLYARSGFGLGWAIDS